MTLPLPGRHTDSMAIGPSGTGVSGPVITAFACPRCGRVSRSGNDVRYGYCGHCCDFTGDTPELRAAVADAAALADLIVPPEPGGDDQACRAPELAVMLERLRGGAATARRLQAVLLAREAAARLRAAQGAWDGPYGDSMSWSPGDPV